MFVMANKIKELFASTLNGITASVRCVSSVIVVQNAKLPGYLGCTQTKNRWWSKKPDKNAAFC